MSDEYIKCVYIVDLISMDWQLPIVSVEKQCPEEVRERNILFSTSLSTSVRKYALRMSVLNKLD